MLILFFKHAYFKSIFVLFGRGVFLNSWLFHCWDLLIFSREQVEMGLGEPSNSSTHTLENAWKMGRNALWVPRTYFHGQLAQHLIYMRMTALPRSICSCVVMSAWPEKEPTVVHSHPPPPMQPLQMDLGRCIHSTYSSSSQSLWFFLEQGAEMKFAVISALLKAKTGIGCDQNRG